MSHYNSFKTQMKDQEALVRALERSTCGRIKPSLKGLVESHEKPVEIYDYHGHAQAEKAHVVIRKGHLGQISNDIGFVRQDDGTFKAIIGDVEDGSGSYSSTGFDKAWQTKLATFYNVEAAKIAFEKRGIPVTETLDDKGRIQLRAKFQTEATTQAKIQVRR